MNGQILWGVMPYIVMTIFIGGHIYRYQHDQFGWTAKSSELLEKKKLAAGS
ncbi:TPA: respiratory nitrate reductase subunit gamma, partial [Escherichia coli]|nr:respiratory nitrate reductase subunit gamma [Escherichia coli]